MKPRYELIIFDWDGTLMDSVAKIVSCFSAALADAGEPNPGEIAIRHIIGLGLDEHPHQFGFAVRNLNLVSEALIAGRILEVAPHAVLDL